MPVSRKYSLGFCITWVPVFCECSVEFCAWRYAAAVVVSNGDGSGMGEQGSAAGAGEVQCFAQAGKTSGT